MVAAGAVLLAPYAEFTLSDTSTSAEPRVKRVTMEADVRSVPPDPDTAIYPSPRYRRSTRVRSLKKRTSTPVTINSKPIEKSTPMVA